MKRLKFYILSLSALPLIAGCSNVKNSLGLVKDSPDEFAVITRAPLEMPPSMSLPEPNLGAPRPQEQSALNQAEEAVLGSSKQKSQDTSALESALLNNAGTQNAEQNIRATVNKETKEMADRNKPVAQKLLDMGGKSAPSATVVDAKKESERIQQSLKDGSAVTGDDTAYIEE